MRRLIGAIYAPAMLLVFNGTAILVIGTGWPHATLAGLALAAIVVSFACERWAPYQPDWNRPQGDAWRDLAHALANEGLTLLALGAIPLLAAVRPWGGIWPTDWPLWAQWLVAVVVADLGITLTHYFSHRWAWLWRFHAVHHSPVRMYGFNGLMKHPVHLAAEMGVGTTPLLLAGMPYEVALLLGFSVMIQLLLQHSNVDMRIGALRYVLALAPVHRSHHRKWAKEGDVNFGLFLTVWDRLLGTAVWEPEHRFTSDDIGIGTQPDYPVGYLAQLAEPFRKTEAPSVSEAS